MTVHKAKGKKGIFSKAIISLALLIAAYVLYWAAGRSVIVKNFNETIMSARQSGHSVQPKSFTLSGFPFSFKGHMRSLLLGAPQASSPWSIRSENLHLEAASYNPLKWDIYHAGDARLDMRGPVGQRWLFDIRPLLLDGDVSLSYKGDIKSILFNADKLRPHAVIGTEPPFRALDGFRAQITPNRENVDIALDLENIFLSAKVWAPLQKVFGPRLETVSLKAQAVGLSALSQEAVASWSKEPRLTSSDWLVKWNGIDLRGDFDLTKSSQGVSGNIRIILDDERAFFEAMTASGLITSTQASLMKFALASRPKTDSQTNGAQKEINLILANSQLTLFGQPIYKY